MKSLVLRIWGFEFGYLYNKSLKQVQLNIGKRYFNGSTNHTKRFFVLKINQKDIITF